MSDERTAYAVLDIDLDALVGNWRALRDRLSPGTICAGIVKADAYGLGMARVAPSLAAAGCKVFFVAQLGEAVALRRLLPDVEIAVLNGLLPGSTSEFIAHRLIPVLNDLGQIAEWRAAGGGNPAIIHVDTGMARLGLPADELARLAADPALLAGLTVRAVMSHLACADEADHPHNARQLAAFAAARAVLPGAPASLANSSGIFLGPGYHFDIARPGAAVYGVNPLPGRPNPMTQVIRLKGRILQTRDVDTGDFVGYGSTHRREGPGRIATVAIGYADGWLRSLSNRGSVAIAGQRVPVVGRISMDLMTIDVTGLDPQAASPGNFADLIGPGNDVDTVAAAAGTIGYEVLTALGDRYHRIYRGGAA
ncbi:MAG TPA: alanine racemase [Stellaceae bacterium]|jgi:alanine racemase|nr:alanine racemase [Stellaceae bacterium]